MEEINEGFRKDMDLDLVCNSFSDCAKTIKEMVV